VSEELKEPSDHLVLITGVSGTGKSTSFRGIPIDKQPRWGYLNCEAG